jgi:hypothetical protein
MLQNTSKLYERDLLHIHTTYFRELDANCMAYYKNKRKSIVWQQILKHYIPVEKKKSNEQRDKRNKQLKILEIKHDITSSAGRYWETSI